MRVFKLPAVLVVLVTLSIAGCAHLGAPPKIETDDCITALSEQFDHLPEQSYLETLDGQRVSLEEFQLQCLAAFPSCVLYPKFYYWKSEILELTSTSSRGPTPTGSSSTSTWT